MSSAPSASKYAIPESLNARVIPKDGRKSSSTSRTTTFSLPHFLQELCLTRFRFLLFDEENVFSRISGRLLHTFGRWNVDTSVAHFRRICPLNAGNKIILLSEVFWKCSILSRSIDWNRVHDGWIPLHNLKKYYFVNTPSPLRFLLPLHS